MYQKAITKLITSINNIYRKAKREEITLGVARKYGLPLAFKQFQKELNKLSQKEANRLSKESKRKGRLSMEWHEFFSTYS